MNGTEGRKRSADRHRALLTGVFAGAVGFLGLTGAATPTPSTSTQRSSMVVALQAGPAVPRTFPLPTASSGPTTVGAVDSALAAAASAASAGTAGASDTTQRSTPSSTAATRSASPPPTSDAPATPAPASPGSAPASAPAPAAGSVEDAIATYFGDVYDQAVGVARCESGLDPNAVSRGGANWGLFQINTVHQQRVADMGYSWDQILDPYVNAAVARSIYDDAGGWGPWGCRRAAY